MFHKITFVLVVLSVVILGIFLTHFSKTNDLLSQYQRYGFLKSDIKYQGVEKMWGEQGLIFYQVEFPFLEVPHHADKMTFSVQEATSKVTLSNLHLNVKEAMQKIHGPDLESDLESYVPFSEFFDKFLTSLSVLGIDEFIGDISLNTTYSDIKTMNFVLQANQNQQETLQMSGVIHVPVVGAHHLSDLWKGNLKSIDLKIQDNSLLKQYLNYAKSRGKNIPASLKSGYLKLTNLTTKLPKVTEILR